MLIKKGFTMSVVNVVLVIIGIMISVAVSSVLNYFKISEDQRLRAYARGNF